MMKFTLLAVVVLCITPSLCVSSFDYKENHPLYKVGSTIETNTPVNLGEGIYTVSPELPEGLKLDTKTGYITGKPTVQAWLTYTFTYNGGKESESVCLSPPVVNCGVSKLTAVSLINTYITCTSTSDVTDEGWSITPKKIRGITQDGPYLRFQNFNPQNSMTITIKAENEVGSGTFDIQIEKVENPELKDGIYVRLYDLDTTPCGNYYDGIAVYEWFNNPIPNLDGLTSFDNWKEKMYIYMWGTITTTNGTMDGFINIETAGEYTFYLQTGNEMGARVYIDDEEILSDWGECKAWSDTPLSKKLTLTTGYHRVLIEFMGGKGLDFHFVFDYSTPGSSERKTIPFKYYHASFNPVMFLTADAVEVSWLYDAFSLTSLHVSRGVATSCWITNDAKLPDGSEVTVDGIKGHPQDVMEPKEYKLKCKNQESETNEITLKLRVTKTSVSGVIAYYYKPYDFDTSLYTKYGPDVDGLNAEYIQKENKPYVEETEDQPHPAGLSIEFLDDYGVYWEGYMYKGMDSAGLYNYKVVAEGAYWIYVDFKEVLSKPGRNSVDDPSYFDFNITDDDYFVQIYYVSHNGHAYFSLYRKINTASEDRYRNSIPFRYVPVNDYFMMTQSTATYVTGQEVQNYALPVESFGCDSMVIDPPLPEGLNQHCQMSQYNPVVIEGVPTTTSLIELTEHKIKVTSTQGKSVSTTIYIGVKPVQSPSGFYVQDLETGSIYDESIELVVGQFYDLQFHMKQGYVIAFTTESVPVGFTYTWETSTLSGSPREKLDTKITVTAIVRPSDGDNKQFTFGIKAENKCESGYNMHAFHFGNDFVDNGNYLFISVTASNGTQVFRAYESSTISLPRSYSMCLPTGTYRIYTSSMFDYVFTVYNNGVRIYRYTGHFPLTDSNTVTLNTEPVAPVFKYYTTNATYYAGSQILLVPRVETFVDYFTISPTTLPRNIRFNNITGRIYGKTSRVFNETKYTITAVNGKGQTNVQMIIHVIPDTQEEDCENEGNFLIGLTLAVEKFYERPGYQLINSKDEVVFDVVKGTYIANTVNTVKMCIKKGWYILRLIDFSGFGWSTSNITMTAGNSVIGKYTVFYDDNGERNITTDFTYLTDTHTSWQYSQQYVKDWQFKNGSVLWPSSTIASLPKASSATPTYYLRYALTYPNHDKYTGYFIRIRHRSGVIVRVNGRELFRDKLPAGEITQTTPGDTAYEKAVEENFILPISDLSETAIITYEIHKSPNDDNFPNEDRLFIFPLDGDNDEDCILVGLYGGSVIESSSTSYGKYPSSHAEAAFDLSDGQSWNDYYGIADGQSYADYSFGSHNHYAVNQFTIIAGTGTLSHYPMKVAVTGTTTSGQVGIGGLDPVSYFIMKKYSPGRATFNIDPYTLYSSIRIDIPKSNQYDPTNKGMEVREIGYHLCRYKKCPVNPTESLPEGVSNTFYKANCSTDIAGERYFYCSNFGLWHEINSTCKEPPKFTTIVTTVTLQAGEYYFNEAIYEVTGNPTVYSFACSSCATGEFIPGMTYSVNNGLLSGTPYKGATYSITFTATNNYGYGQITMTIIISPSPRIIVWNYEYIYITDVYAECKDKQLFWVESPTTVTYSADELPTGLTINSATGLLNGRPTRPTEQSYTFVISNSGGDKVTRTVFFRINVPDDPVMVEFVDKLELVYMYTYSPTYPVLCYATTLTYEVNKALPASLTYNTTTGAMSGKVTTPVQSAVTYTFSCKGANKTITKDIPVSIIQTDFPVIVSQNESISLKTGQELFNEQFFTVSGSNLIYSVSPALPNGITMDAKTGKFSGYGKVSSTKRSYTINVSNGRISVQVVMDITVEKSETPVIPDSTVQKNASIATGTLVSIKLFDSVGDGLIVSVNPTLPEGFILSASGYLQGTSVVDVAAKDYVITLTDSNSKTASVTIRLSFIAMKCPANNGFDETSVGDQAVKKCGGSKTGFITRKCIYADGKAIWQSPIDECSASTIGPLIGIIIACIIVGGVIFLGGYCIYVRVGGRTKHVRKTAEQMVDASKDTGVRI